MLAALPQRQRPASAFGPVARDPTERRRHPRHNAIGQVVRVDALGVVGLARIVNLSDGGAMLRISAVLAQGGPVRISFDCTNVLQGQVAWSSNGFIGIRFLQPIACGNFIGKITSDRRGGAMRAPRLPCNSAGHVKTRSGNFAMIVSDVSEKGMKICHGGSLPAGTSVEIILERRMRFLGTIRWSDYGFAGVEIPGKIAVDELSDTRSF